MNKANILLSQLSNKELKLVTADTEKINARTE